MVELEQMLEARESRVKRQQELLKRYGLPLVSFTMNIAGPVKNSPDIRRGFLLGRMLLFGQLKRVKAEIVFEEEIDEATGCEGLYVVNLPAEILKEIAIETEESIEAGRLFDMDVIDVEGNKLERSTERCCLICGKPAKECARNRTHSVEELQKKTEKILSDALNRYDSETAASLSLRALLYEVAVTPKPGLVDRLGNGSHSDMDFYSFMTSSSTLYPYFAECFLIGRKTKDEIAEVTFSKLRSPGKLAEGRMLLETGGINTHKGAIFTMGIMCGALGRLEKEKRKDPAAVLSEASYMTRGIEDELSEMVYGAAKTAGELSYAHYGVTGIRGEAASGFPTVLNTGLPVLEEGLRLGKSNDEAGRAALLAIISRASDTNMISRGGLKLHLECSRKLSILLSKDPYPNEEILENMDREFTERNLSPGGSADLLALCWLLHFLKEEG